MGMHELGYTHNIALYVQLNSSLRLISDGSLQQREVDHRTPKPSAKMFPDKYSVALRMQNFAQQNML